MERAASTSGVSARARDNAYTRKQVDSFFERSTTRPASTATEIIDTDFEDESEFEESSPKRSFDSVSRVRKSTGSNADIDLRTTADVGVKRPSHHTTRFPLHDQPGASNDRFRSRSSQSRDREDRTCSGLLKDLRTFTMTGPCRCRHSCPRSHRPGQQPHFRRRPSRQ